MDISVSLPITIDIAFLVGHDNSLYEEKQEKSDSGEIGIKRVEFILVGYTSLKQ